MALHVPFWFENIDQAGVLQGLAAGVDPFTPQVMPANGDYLDSDPRLPLIIGIHAAIDATTQARCRLVAASFAKRYGRSSVEVPLLSSTNEPASPHCFNDLRLCPIRVGGDKGAAERLSFEADANPAAAADQFVVPIFADKVPTPLTSLDGYTWMRFTTTASAATANTIARRALTPVDTLDAGTYSVAGGYAISTTLIAAGLVFVGSDLRVPIGAKDTRTDVVHPFFQPGQLGELGKFTDRNPPSVDLLLDAADNEVQVVDLLVKKVA